MSFEISHHFMRGICGLLPAGRRRCSSRRLNSKAPRGDDRPSRLLSRAGHESGRRLGSTVAPCPVVTIGMTGPPGGVFNLTERTSGDLVVSKSVRLGVSKRLFGALFFTSVFGSALLYGTCRYRA